MNFRLIVSTAMSTVIFATHVRCKEMPGALIDKSNSQMLVYFKRSIELDERKIADIKTKCEEIKKLQVDRQENPDAESYEAEKQKIKQSLAFNDHDMTLIAENIKEYNKIVFILEALLKSGETRQSLLPEEEQKKMYNCLDRVSFNIDLNIINCNHSIASFERYLAKYKAEQGVSNPKLKILYNQKICALFEQLKQFTTELRDVNKQIAHVIMYGTIPPNLCSQPTNSNTAAPNQVSQTNKWSTTKKVLVVGVAFLCIVVLVAVGVAVRLYKS